MANKKSTSTSHSSSTIKLTELDKLALVAETLPGQKEEIEKQITEYAGNLLSSPVMRRYLRDITERIQQDAARCDEDIREYALAFCIAELHFAENTSLVC
jgi:hypothetical protein